jgi:hypothetical protein
MSLCLLSGAAGPLRAAPQDANMPETVESGPAKEVTLEHRNARGGAAGENVVIGEMGSATATPHQYAQTIGPLGRRDLILALIGLCAGVLGRASGGHGEVRSNSEALADWVRDCGGAFFSDLTALRRLGAIYLAAYPEERSRALLSHLLIGADDGAIPSRLLSAVARNWSGNHVVVVDGWLLARAEARLCAFLHLEEGARA